MTELEKQLLSALEQLQQDYSKRLDEWENAFAEWRTMSGLIQRENAALNGRVTVLSRQVQSLSEQLRQVCRKAERDRNSPAAGAGGAAPESAGAGTIAVAASWSFAMISRVLLISCYVKIFKFFNMRYFMNTYIFLGEGYCG